MAAVGPDAAYPPPPPYDAATYTNPAAYPPAVTLPAGATALGMFKTDNFTGGFSVSGLDLLRDYDMVKITKLMNQEEAFTYIDQPRKFVVCNNEERQLFSMLEAEDMMSCHAHYRSFLVNAVDPSGTNVFQIKRDSSGLCSYCCFCCACFGKGCKSEVDVIMRNNTIGSVKQNCSFASPNFTIYGKSSGDDKELVHIDGGNACCRPTTEFGLRHPSDNAPSGRIQKRGYAFGGLENNYNCYFPPGSDNELKVMCIAAVVLFDYRFYNRIRPRRR